ncbi:DUF5104 domain-containing protein [Anaerobium acetethylicum]|uniref:DUF5104 domain-containing protein n=1 Tax=Anaerobium acetethylicum TaxID=1619234 RepID=A0A1D3TTQ1_9FIRM|nr:DUF5104 domain-containing protein [Anaerobium acetethylicum]SCP97353.1 protein of unknown function [Anaerobium acetethylicum]
MKKKIKFMLLVYTLFLLSACSLRKDIHSYQKIETECDEIVQYLSEDDTEGLKSMFCNMTRSSSEFDKQIQVAMDYFEGKVIEHDPFTLKNDGSSVENGKITRLYSSPHLTGIVTDVGKTYEIKFYSYIINTDDEDKVGISKLTIKTDNGNECIIGEYIR